jgi:hypothetical protein
MSISEVEISPDGSRLAWVLTAVHHPPLFLDSIWPPTRYASVWVSDLGGSNRRELATGDGDPGNENGVNGPQYVRWTRDGKDVTFLYDQALWAVPAGGS